MQEWLKDKKNLPIVAGLGATVLILAVVAMLFEMGILPPQSQPAAVVAAAPSQGAVPPGVVPPGAVPPGAPGAPPTPGTPPAGAPGAKPAARAVSANVAKGPDPFRAPLTPIKVDPAVKNAMRVRNALPPVFIQQYPQANAVSAGGATNTPPVELNPQISSSMRMSGVVFTDNAIKAILETNGVSQQVQPGDLVEGGRVISIQADGLTLRTADSRLVRVPLSGATTGGAAPGPTDTGGPPVGNGPAMPPPTDTGQGPDPSNTLPGQ